jgi:hypothetical protein
MNVPLSSIYMNTTSNRPAPQSLIAHFGDLSAPRINRTKDHALIDVLVIAICTLLCGGEIFNDMEDFGLAKRDWFASFLSLRNGIPSHDTFNRVLAALDPKGFLDCFLRWTQSVRQAISGCCKSQSARAIKTSRRWRTNRRPFNLAA